MIDIPLDDLKKTAINKFLDTVEVFEDSLNKNIITQKKYDEKIEETKNTIINEVLTGASEDLKPFDYIGIEKELSAKFELVLSNYDNYDISQFSADKMYKKYYDSITRENKNKISTNFEKFDKVLKGIPSGLTIVTALSSLGKSTFCIQLADQIAMSGNKVLYMNAEMQNHHTWIKSIIRLSGNYAQLSFQDIMNIENQSDAKIKSFIKAQEDYNKYSHNIVIKKCSKMWLKELYRDIEALKKINDDKPPVVFIDYLQILQPLVDSKSKGNEYIHINEIMNALKILIQDTGAYIIAISSLNRASYDKPISLSSLKGSGNLEYSADFVMAIQPNKNDFVEAEPIYNNKTGNYNSNLINQWKRKKDKNITINILKNRMGITGVEFDFIFQSAKAKFIACDVLDDRQRFLG